MKKLIQEEAGASRSNRGNFAIIAKFRYNSDIFAMYSNFATKRIFASVAKFRYIAKISPVAKSSTPYFFVQTNPFWLISFLPSL